MRSEPSPHPTEPPGTSAAIPVRTIGLMRPLVWLGFAWHDMLRAGWVSFAHGVAVVLGGGAIVAVAYHRFWLLAGALSGFMVVAPVLATSLYALSRALERKEQANWGVVRRTWLAWQGSHSDRYGQDYWCMVQFGALLALAATGWVMTSAALITLLAPVPVHTPLDFVHHVVLAPDGWLFELWLALGGMMAAPMFASSVVSMPLLLDRRVTLLQAVLTSWRVVLANPVPMAAWAAIIMVFTLLGLGTLLLGLIPIIPMLGHASWHAYRELVDVSDLPAREALSAPYVRPPNAKA